MMIKLSKILKGRISIMERKEGRGEEPLMFE